MAKPSFQAPTGTRDFYPTELLRRRYIEKLWRDTSIRHGFAEIDGPTFEHLELYTAKSGEGIVSELFSFRRDSGEKDFALRPEFTPTLARLYAAKANSLPKPTKWFWQQTCFRAERPQRGRLREFFQWNCDILGDASPDADAEIIFAAVDLLRAAGLKPDQISARVGSRTVACEILKKLGVAAQDESLQKALQALDKSAKMKPEDHETECLKCGFSAAAYREHARTVEAAFAANTLDALTAQGFDLASLAALRASLAALNILPWCVLDLNIARGLAYYTGMVFELIVDGERAVAGGGRYDNLIELFGGPPTPGVGFGMGDVVLSLILQDKGLLPSEEQVLDELSKPSASYRPQVFVIAASDEAAPQVKPLIAALRTAGLHARTTTKTTRNVGKLLQDAGSQKALRAVIIENAMEAKIKDLMKQTESGPFPLKDVLHLVS